MRHWNYAGLLLAGSLPGRIRATSCSLGINLSNHQHAGIQSEYRAPITGWKAGVNKPQRRRVFITLHGIAAFLGGAILFVIALVVAIVQVAAVARRRELLRFLPPALGATAVGLLSGIFFALSAEYQWMSGALLDDLVLPVMIAALAWMFYNRIGSRRNRIQSNQAATPR